MNVDFQVNDKINVINTSGKAIPATVTAVEERDGETYVAYEYDPSHPIYKVLQSGVHQIGSRSMRLELVERPQETVESEAQSTKVTQPMSRDEYRVYANRMEDSDMYAGSMPSYEEYLQSARRKAVAAFVDATLRTELADYRERVIVDIDDWFENFADNWNAEAIELIGAGSIHEAERHAEAITASGGDMESARWMLS